ncbi:beta-1,3-galactosyltransferase 5-like [Saccostrea echinata]|uniref:beta-1,3-galactosyltransferase 5-like n=1 Tax=Saccostrea echinata TaxID=191078 RepID=UPI002A7F3A4D|nr:beta-1,3-galactosyltransferase 5-like [Saccostrea echinata]XP_061196984.1 beta-1,3-galactosyltransferase 5-like [Saccostrea echinata]XP_061196985.1 beta-1,3-galactosyltransferase 5-like [Saccostrea echinata]
MVQAMKSFLFRVFLTCVFLTCTSIILVTNTVKTNQEGPRYDLKEPSAVYGITKKDLPPTNGSSILNVSKTTATPFYAHITYITNPSTICDSFKTYNGTKILMLVKSSPENFHLRKWIRFKSQTYKDYKDSVKTLFLLGQSATRDKDLLKESKVFGDIIQGSFIDAYRNLTYKTVMGYRWMSEYCVHSEFVVYRDDDFKINIVNLMKQIKAHKAPQTMFMGLLVKKGHMIYRNPKHKWYLSKEDYPQKVLPPYFPGGAYLVSTTIAKKLVSNFHLVKWLPIDDVYIGLVAQKSNISLTHSKLFEFKNCDKFHTSLACREFTRPQEVLDAWRAVTVDDLEKTKTS